ncbi:MAG: oxygen-independent coproporphyrinogen III oxidase [Lachnospiraceae bacterium]|nr:oxygen-independent coproporphyrinogen III oxidase [Lachnospiraceae bacterium]
MALTKKKPLAIYIHLPFCAQKCLYCDFASGPADSKTMAYYMRVLLKEIRSFSPITTLYRVESIFFGGGTPSFLPPLYIEQLMQQLRSQFEISEQAEITLEANPGTLEEEKLRIYKAAGINRLSLGLQSVHENELKLLGRIHSYEDFLHSYRLARQTGFRNINVDLMSGLPGQSPASWRESLRQVADLNPEHISAYSLSIEEGTPFYEKYGSGLGRLALPGDEADREMYHETKSFLAERGYNRYEISNYAKAGMESRHNLTYWTMGEYLGFGQAAASFLENRRVTNPSGTEEYYQAARVSYRRFKETPPESEKEQMEEYMFLGLRTARGVSREEFKKRFRVSFPPVYERTLLDLYKQGLLALEKDRIVLTDQGIDVSNIVLAGFLLD